MLLSGTVFLSIFPGAGLAHAQGVLPMKERAAVMDAWLEERLNTVVPELMRREGFDVWMVAAREYNEDPVIETMLPATWLAARRRTVLLFHDPGSDAPVERLAVSRYDIGTMFRGVWDPDTQPDQWARVAEILREWNPKAIGINVSETFGLADGLTSSEHALFLDAIGPEMSSRVAGAERLAVGWLETRTPSEMLAYPTVMRIARGIIEEGLSELAITPGVTTTDDVQWWYRDRIRDRGLVTWFHPSVDVQRADDHARDNDFSAREGSQVILPGDLVHMDFGITYLGLNTDTQMLAYVLKPGETGAPKGLVDGLAVGNRLQDILTGAFKTGKSGNAILADALAQAREEGIAATIYTHPIGFHGHAAGPTIGLWDAQQGVPGKGDYPLYPNTAHSIELNAAVQVPEWDGKMVRIMLEEDAFFDGDTVRYIDSRQEELLLIPRQ
ncbi:MAG: Xaa-Pro aminopeptidase [Bacteroidetes bacterium CG12_big_fil_rev_8_21_14_0_65_60_17]|nr:MAG: Xaa-Pro aminopeptidase [Bacteroidetes bacterium CG12_big_fil_rev_8_21_14_0_65_60_17]